MNGYLEEDAIRKAIDTPKVAYELGRLVGIFEMLGIPVVEADSLWAAIGSELLDTNEHDCDRRLRYIISRLADHCELEDSILDPVRNPDDYTGDSVRENVIEQLVANIVDARILDYEEWRREELEIARDEAIQHKIDVARGK